MFLKWEIQLLKGQYKKFQKFIQQKLNKDIGDFVERDELIGIIETDKVNVDILSQESGILEKVYAKEGDIIEVGKPFYIIETEGNKLKSQKIQTNFKESQVQVDQQKVEQIIQQNHNEKKNQQNIQKQEDNKQKIMNNKRIIEQNQSNQNLQQQKFEQQQQQKQEQQQREIIQEQNIMFNRQSKTVKMNQMRKTIAKRLKESQNIYAQLTTFQEVDMSQVMIIRKEIQEDFFKQNGVKIGFMSFFIKACAYQLLKQPIVNAVINGTDIIYHNYVDMSVAVATPSGLLVPVIKNVESLSYADIEKVLFINKFYKFYSAKELSKLAKLGREGKISLEQIQGGTFTISNGGIFGSLLGTPILNPPQSAILGMHNIVNRPVVKGKEIVARPIMYLALTYDHRLIDGKDAATFLKRIKELIEDPKKIIFDI